MKLQNKDRRLALVQLSGGDCPSWPRDGGKGYFFEDPFDSAPWRLIRLMGPEWAKQLLAWSISCGGPKPGNFKQKDMYSMVSKIPPKK